MIRNLALFSVLLLSYSTFGRDVQENFSKIFACYLSKGHQLDPGQNSMSLNTAEKLALFSYLVYEDTDTAEAGARSLGFPKAYFIRAVRNEKNTLPDGKTKIILADSEVLWAESDDAIVLAFRGTKTGDIQDLTTDILVKSEEFGNLGQVHSGFYGALAILWPQIHQLMNLPRARPKPLYITGHSLGGAMATLAAAKFLKKESLFYDRQSQDPDFVENWTLPYLEALYTYGSPKVGDEKFVTLFNMMVARQAIAPLRGVRGTVIQPKTYSARFVRTNDGIARLPFPIPLTTRYEPVDHLHYLDAGEVVQINEDSDRFKKIYSIDLEDSLGDHHIDGYLERIYEVLHASPSGCQNI